MINRCLDLSAIVHTDKSAFLFGPRGVGKTFLCENFIKTQKTTLEISLLKHDEYLRYLTRPALFRDEIEHEVARANTVVTVLVDEIQKLPQLLDEVHYLIEKNKGKVRFILTGSSARKLKRSGANLLAGRALTLKLHPVSFIESSIDIRKVVQFGSMPSLLPDYVQAERVLKSYVETYLKEEIMQEALVRNVEGYIRFLDLAAQANGEPVNFTAIGRQSHVSTKTVQEYFSILVDTLIAFRIDGWSHSIRKQLSQNPRYYFFDCGILNALRGELRTEFKESSYTYGKMFETLVVQEIIRLNDYTDSGYRFNYWRTNTGLEVDMILSRGKSEQLIAIEIKSSAMPIESDVHGLKSFLSENNNAKALCFCTAARRYCLGNIEVFPWQEGIKSIFHL
jgi:predicted AAA+ superfamily ATPase